jgi:quercetin dioxygenase-like cupin family protein
MAKNPSRRNFIRAAPLAAAASLPLAERFLVASTSGFREDQTAPAAAFQLFTAEKLAEAMKMLQAKPGNDSLYAPQGLPLTIVLTTEEKKSAKEFEWHEGRDHILLVHEGETHYELGGKPKDAHSNKKPGEWLAPMSDGSTSLTLKKGDMLVIPRGTPHKRSTEGSVTFTLISAEGAPAT